MHKLQQVLQSNAVIAHQGSCLHHCLHLSSLTYDFGTVDVNLLQTLVIGEMLGFLGVLTEVNLSFKIFKIPEW